MGRVKQVCPHGVLGKAQCKICQREQHTDRVRELRQQRKELEDQENTLQKEYAREHTKVFVNESGKKVPVAKNIQEPSIPEVKSCGSCRFRDILDCNVYKRFANTKEHPCKGYKSWKGVRT